MSCPFPRIPAPPLSATFFRNGFEMSKRLGCDFVHLLMVMNFEGAGVNPGACNAAGAYGLIQVMNLKGVGWTGTVDDYLHLSAEDQLPYVERFLSAYKSAGLTSARRIHQALFVPATLSQGSDPDLVLVAKNGTRFPNKQGVPQEPLYYSSNAAAFDRDPVKGFITCGDLERAEVRGAQSPRFMSILAGLKAAVPEANVPDKIAPLPMPVPSKPAVAAATIAVTVEAFPWASVAILAAVGIGGTLLLAHKNPYGVAAKAVASITSLPHRLRLVS